MKGAAGLLAVWLAADMVGGCSSMKPYPGSPDKNVTIRTEAKSGSLLSSVHAALHVHSADGRCVSEYQGTVELTEPVMRIGLPRDRPAYLVFSFGSSSLLGSSSSTMRYETLLRPRAGHAYDVHVRYVDDFYSVTIRETDARTSSSRDLPRTSLKSCATGSIGSAASAAVRL